MSTRVHRWLIFITNIIISSLSLCRCLCMSLSVYLSVFLTLSVSLSPSPPLPLSPSLSPPPPNLPSLSASRMETHGHPMCIHVTAATRALLGEDGTDWADYGRRIIKGASYFLDLCYQIANPLLPAPLLLDYGCRIIRVRRAPPRKALWVGARAAAILGVRAASRRDRRGRRRGNRGRDNRRDVTHKGPGCIVTAIVYYQLYFLGCWLQHFLVAWPIPALPSRFFYPPFQPFNTPATESPEVLQLQVVDSFFYCCYPSRYIGRASLRFVVILPIHPPSSH